MISWRSASDVATPRFCSTTSRPIPSAARSLIVCTSPSTIVGASPSDGSSITSTFGLVSSARPIASICCSPPDSDVPLTFLRSASRGNSS